MNAVEAQLLDVSQLEEARCEATHYHSSHPACTVSVTHRYWSCVRPEGINICRAGAVWVLSKTANTTCLMCLKNAQDCWRIVAI